MSEVSPSRSRRICIVTPAPANSRRGNRITAERWAVHLRALGHTVEIEESWSEGDAELLIALHARRSAASIAAFAGAHPTRPIVLVLTGTDLHQDIHTDRVAQRSLELATRIVALHDRAGDELTPTTRAKLRVILQSVEPPDRREVPPPGELRIVVLGHLRAVKDPLLAAHAARRLPRDSSIRIVQCGEALEADYAELARREQRENPRYEWRGDVAHDAAKRLLAGARLHVLTSRLEGGANALCEAIACGVPTLATRIPGSIGILGPEYPGYFEVGDAAGLCDAMLRVERDPAFERALRFATERVRDRVLPATERAALQSLVAEFDD